MKPARQRKKGSTQGASARPSRPSPAADVPPDLAPLSSRQSKRLLAIQNRQRTQPIDSRFLRRIVELVLTEHLLVPSWELGLHLVGAREMAEVNQAFLQHEGSTDVITFDHSEEPADAPAAPGSRSLHGEIYVSVPDAMAQAREFKTTWTEEVVRYAIHGLLHLLGHDDLQPAARRVMKRAEHQLVAVVAKNHPLARLRRKRRN